MDMSFGKYRGKSVAWVLLEDPQYFVWMENEHMQEKEEFQFAMKLINIFNSMPFKNVKCIGGCRGQNPVTRLTLYNGICNGNYWFCDYCNPYNLGANSGKLIAINTFQQAMRFSDYRSNSSIVKVMAAAKGVPKRKTKKALKEFFRY